MESHRLHAGRVIDGFKLVELVHTGGMAALWSVTKPGEPRAMLMKVPFLGEGDDHSAIIGFEIEHMILPRLSGPHVPAVIAVGDFSVLPHLVIERLPGKSLDSRLKDAPLSPEDVCWLGAKIATAKSANATFLPRADANPHVFGPANATLCLLAARLRGASTPCGRVPGQPVADAEGAIPLRQSLRPQDRTGTRCLWKAATVSRPPADGEKQPCAVESLRHP